MEGNFAGDVAGVIPVCVLGRTGGGTGLKGPGISGSGVVVKQSSRALHFSLILIYLNARTHLYCIMQAITGIDRPNALTTPLL